MASAKVDNRGSLGSKRSRNDAARAGDWACRKCGNMNFSFRTECNRQECRAPRPKEKEWTCRQCGNLNYGFRTECNRKECRAPRPSDSPRVGTTTAPGGFTHLAPPYFDGIGAPLSMPYVMSSGYGGPLPPYGMRYDYGPHSSTPGAYGIMSPYGPPGPMGGMGYGPGSGIDGYGFPLRGSPLHVPGPWIEGALPDNNASRKRRGGPDGLQEGDWICPKCDNVNFAFRTTCNMKKCETPRPTPGSNHGASSNMDSSDAHEGSWTCNKCNNLNYHFRTVCNRKGCGNEKPASNN